MSIIPLLAVIFILSACNENKRSEEQSDVTTTASKTSEPVEDQRHKDKSTILFFGNSLTAGYGLPDQQSFPALIQKRIDSLQLSYQVINAGVSGETSSGGKERIDWVLRSPVDIFVLELGANDMLRGLDLKATADNLDQILRKVKEKYPDVQLIIAGMQAPPNMGNDYVKEFSAIFPQLAKKYNAGLISFLLEGVAGQPKLNLSDGKHPNAQGQKIVRDNVWQVLKYYLK